MESHREVFAIVNDIVKAIQRDVSCSLYMDNFVLHCSRGSVLNTQNPSQTNKSGFAEQELATSIPAFS